MSNPRFIFIGCSKSLPECLGTFFHSSFLQLQKSCQSHMKAVAMTVPTSKRHCWCLRWSAVAVSLRFTTCFSVLSPVWRAYRSQGLSALFIVSFEAVELTDSSSFCSSPQVVLVSWTLGNLLHSPNSADCNLHQCVSTIRLQRRPRRLYPS